MSLSLLDFGSLVVRSNLTEQAQGIGFVSTLLIIPGEVDSTLSTFERLLRAVG
jgi:hypothetical protein